MSTAPRLLRLTNCRLAVGDALVRQDLWVNGTTGTIVNTQASYFAPSTNAVEVLDLGGRIVAPGFIDVQINGSYGFDFSTPSPTYASDLRAMNRRLVATGVTSYLPTLPSQGAEVYHQVR